MTTEATVKLKPESKPTRIAPPSCQIQNSSGTQPTDGMVAIDNSDKISLARSPGVRRAARMTCRADQINRIANI
jgi:hypothetical protein